MAKTKLEYTGSTFRFKSEHGTWQVECSGSHGSNRFDIYLNGHWIAAWTKAHGHQAKSNAAELIQDVISENAEQVEMFRAKNK